MERLRGLNMGGWLSQLDAIEEKDPKGFVGTDAHFEQFADGSNIAEIGSWGFNHVRLPIDHQYFFTEDVKPIERRFEVLDKAVDAAKDAGIQIVIDLHKCPGHTFHDETKAVQQLFVDDSYVKKTERIWQIIALRYSNLEHVIFEVLNEPVAPDAAIWDILKNRLCKAIRQVASDNRIIVGSNMWNWPSTYPLLTPVPLDGIIYCFHFYEPLLFTHQKAAWLSEPEFLSTREYPGDYGPGVMRQYDLLMSDGVWNKARFETALKPVIDFRKTHKVDVICNEFGCYVEAPRTSALRWLSDLLSVLKANDFGFTYWNYKNLDFGIYSIDEQKHSNLPQYQNSNHLDLELLKVLKSN